MLSVLAWIVFVPALILNITIFILALNDYMLSPKSKIKWTSIRNICELAFSLIILFIPGVYLFGWF
jgi:hypothetical protein